MTPRAAAAIAASLLATVEFAGCVEDGCAYFASDPRCVDTSSGARISVLTRRLPTRGGAIQVRVSDLSMNEPVYATLGAGGPRVDFIMEPDGSGEAQVPQGKLEGIATGPLTLSVFAGSSSQTKQIRVYSLASFDEASRSTVSFTDRQPSYIQISQQHIFAALDRGMERRIDEYQQSGATLLALGLREALLDPGEPTYLLDVSETQLFKLFPSGMVSYNELDDTKAHPYFPLKELSLTALGALAVDRQSQVIAVAGSGPDGPLKALTVPPMGQAVTELSITDLSSKPVVGLGWGNINSDNLLDLVAQHDDHSFAVYLRRDAAALAYDAALSTALSAAAGAASISRFSVADLDRDGLDDVIAAQGNQIVQLTNEGDAMWSQAILKSDLAADAIATGDVTGDGKPDLALSQKSPAMLSLYPNLAP